MQDVWRYTINQGDSGGIVIAQNEKEAISKVKSAYQHRYWAEAGILEESCIEVWKADIDDDYNKEHPDVLLVY